MKKITLILSLNRNFISGLMILVCAFMLNAQANFHFAVDDGNAADTTEDAGATTVTVSLASDFKSDGESSSIMIIIPDGNLNNIG